MHDRSPGPPPPNTHIPVRTAPEIPARGDMLPAAAAARRCNWPALESRGLLTLCVGPGGCACARTGPRRPATYMHVAALGNLLRAAAAVCWYICHLCRYCGGGWACACMQFQGPTEFGTKSISDDTLALFRCVYCSQRCEMPDFRGIITFDSLSSLLRPSLPFWLPFVPFDPAD